MAVGATPSYSAVIRETGFETDDDVNVQLATQSAVEGTFDTTTTNPRSGNRSLEIRDLGAGGDTGSAVFEEIDVSGNDTVALTLWVNPAGAGNYASGDFFQGWVNTTNQVLSLAEGQPWTNSDGFNRIEDASLDTLDGTKWYQVGFVIPASSDTAQLKLHFSSNVSDDHFFVDDIKLEEIQTSLLRETGFETDDDVNVKLATQSAVEGTFDTTTTNPRSGSRSLEIRDLGAGGDTGSAVFEEIDVSGNDTVALTLWVNPAGAGNYASGDFFQGWVNTTNQVLSLAEGQPWTNSDGFNRIEDASLDTLDGTKWYQVGFVIPASSDTAQLKLHFSSNVSDDHFFVDDVKLEERIPPSAESITIQKPTDNHDTNVSPIRLSGISNNAAAGDSVVITNSLGDVDTVAIQADADSSWTATSVELASGADSIVVNLRDDTPASPTVAQDTITVTLDQTAPDSTVTGVALNDTGHFAFEPTWDTFATTPDTVSGFGQWVIFYKKGTGVTTADTRWDADSDADLTDFLTGDSTVITSGLQDNVQYSFVVSYEDGATNLGPLSSEFTFTTRDQTLVLNELNINPATEGDGEWLEIYNTTADTIQVDSYTVRCCGTDQWTIPANDWYIQPGRSIVLASDAAEFNTQWGFLPNFAAANAGSDTDLGSASAFNFTNTADTTALFDDTGKMLDSVRWGSPAGANNDFAISPVAGDGTPSNIRKTEGDEGRVQADRPELGEFSERLDQTFGTSGSGHDSEGPDTDGLEFLPPPEVAITAPADGHDTNVSPITVSGTSANSDVGDSLVVTVDGTAVDTVSLDGSLNWSASSVDLNGLGDSVSVLLKDTNAVSPTVAQDTITVNLDVSAPRITSVSPLGLVDGETVSASDSFVRVTVEETGVGVQGDTLELSWASQDGTEGGDTIMNTPDTTSPFTFTGTVPLSRITGDSAVDFSISGRDRATNSLQSDLTTPSYLTSDNDSGTVDVVPLTTNIKISEVHVRFAGEDWVELYNKSDIDLKIEGIELGTDASLQDAIIPDGAVIPARGFYLVANNATVSGVSADHQESINLAQFSTGDGLRLLSPGGDTIDMFGYNTGGSRGFFETTAFDTNGDPGSYERYSLDGPPHDKLGGNGRDTQNNNTDFFINAASDSNPQNTNSDTEAPRDGVDDGTFRINPKNRVASQGRQTWTLTYEAGSSSWNNGDLQFVFPSAWGAPQISNSSAKNYVTVTSSGSISNTSVSGHTLTVELSSLTTTGQVTVTYGDPTSSQAAYAQAPSTPNDYTFTAKADTNGANTKDLFSPDEVLKVVDPSNIAIDPSLDPQSFVDSRYTISLTVTDGSGTNVYGAVLNTSLRKPLDPNSPDSMIIEIANEDYLPGDATARDVLTQRDGVAQFEFEVSTTLSVDRIDVSDTGNNDSLVHTDTLRLPEPVLSELGWDGGSGDEFIEIYNPAEEVQNVSGWRIIDQDNNVLVSTTEFDSIDTIPVHGYVVIENDEGAVEGQADLISSFSLTNSGETIILQDTGPNLVDQHASGGEWYAGGQDHISMERRFAVRTGAIASAWADADSRAEYPNAGVTGKASPGYPNSESLLPSTLNALRLSNGRYTRADTVDVRIQLLVEPDDTQPRIPSKFVSDNPSHGVSVSPGATDENGYATGVLTANNTEGTSVLNLSLPVSADSGVISDTVVFDYTQPNFSQLTLLSPASEAETNVRDIDFDWTDVNDTLSGLSHYRLQVAEDTNFNTIVENDTYTSSSANPSTTSNLSDTVWHWRVRAVDNVGNTTPFRGPDTFIVDGTPPTLPNLQAPEDKTETNVLTINFDWDASTDTLSGFDRYTLTVDTEASFAGNAVFSGDTTIPDSSVTFTNEDRYFWRVVAFDDAGNSATAGDSEFTIDQTPPLIDTSTLTVSDGVDTLGLSNLDGDSELLLTDHIVKVNVAGATDVRLFLDTGGVVPDTSNSPVVFNRVTGDTWQATISADSIAQGDTPNFILRAEDTATNSVVDDSGGQGFEYQVGGPANTPPTVSIRFPDTGAYVGGDIPGTFVVTDPEDVSGTATIEYDTSPAGDSWTVATVANGDTSVSMTTSGDTNNFTWNSLTDLGSIEDTPVRIRIKVFDGTETGPYDTSPSFTVDNRAPPKVDDLSATAAVSPNPDTGVFLSWSFNDTDAVFFNIYRISQTSDTSRATVIDTLPINIGSITYQDSAVTQGDSYFYYVTAVDTADNESDSSPSATASHVTISKTATGISTDVSGDSLFRPGDTIVYTIDYVNDGFGPTDEIQVVDALPDSTVLTDTASRVSGPSTVIEYFISGTGWQSSSFPRNQVARVRWTISANQDPQSTGSTGVLRFRVEVD